MTNAAGAQLRYLPPYSPDYNSIEQVFAKLKTLLRKAARRTVDTLWATIGDLLVRFPGEECERYIHHAGYGQSEWKRSNGKEWVCPMPAAGRSRSTLSARLNTARALGLRRKLVQEFSRTPAANLTRRAENPGPLFSLLFGDVDKFLIRLESF